jgi:hypothetical protein
LLPPTGKLVPNQISFGDHVDLDFPIDETLDSILPGLIKSHTVDALQDIHADGRLPDLESRSVHKVPRAQAVERCTVSGERPVHGSAVAFVRADEEIQILCGARLSKAASIRPDSKEAEASLNNATTQLSAKRDQQEAKLALLQSNDYASKNQFVEAYNVLADLPDKPRALVTSQLSALTRNYVSAATLRTQKLQEVHIPIKCRADEDAVREAYVLLDRASSLSGDPAITLKRDFLSAKISAHYVDQANRYLEKPSGSGAGVGWL